jgi:hypothetical protein
MITYGPLVLMEFVVTWVLLGGLVYILTRAFGGKLVWKPLLVLVGFALATVFVQTIVKAVSYAFLPNISFPFDLLLGVQGEGQAAIDTIYAQEWVVAYFNVFMGIAVFIWTIALTSLAVRTLAEIPWFKCAAVGAIAGIVIILAEIFPIIPVIPIIPIFG